MGLAEKGGQMVSKAFVAVFVALAMAVTATHGAHAASRPATCIITSEGDATTQGPCLFTADRYGSFVLSPTRGQFLIPALGSDETGISFLSVDVHANGVAEVRAMTSLGVNSRWGMARRLATDRACWEGDGFRVCAYATGYDSRRPTRRR